MQKIFNIICYTRFGKIIFWVNEYSNNILVLSSFTKNKDEGLLVKYFG